MQLIKLANTKQQQKLNTLLRNGNTTSIKESLKSQELRFEFKGQLIWFDLYKLNLNPIFELIQGTFYLHALGFSKPLKSAQY